MKGILLPLSISLFVLIFNHANANDSKKNTLTQTPEPIKCYSVAWESKETNGLGLTTGQAVELCSGTTSAEKTLQCFYIAWAHPDDGGLGLNAGQAVDLCKTNSLP
jgi:hypothetical protein